MSYSRWLESSWYVYPSAAKRIECWRAGMDYVSWDPGETYEDFLKKAEETLTHDADYEAELAELKEILEENMEDIQQWMEKWSKAEE